MDHSKIIDTFETYQSGGSATHGGGASVLAQMANLALQALRVVGYLFGGGTVPYWPPELRR